MKNSLLVSLLLVASMSSIMAQEVLKTDPNRDFKSISPNLYNHLDKNVQRIQIRKDHPDYESLYKDPMMIQKKAALKHSGYDKLPEYIREWNKHNENPEFLTMESKRILLQAREFSQNKSWPRKQSSKKSTEVRPLLDSTISYSYLMNGDSVFSSKGIFTYDALGRELSGEYYSYDSEKGIWTMDYAYVIANYDRDHPYSIYWWNQLTYFYPDTTTGDWIPDYRFSDDVDEMGNLLFDKTEIYDQGSGTWITYEYTEYKYNEMGYQTSYAHYYYDREKQELFGTQKYESVYNEMGYALQYMRYSFDVTTGEWILSYIEEYGFDENGRLTSQSSYEAVSPGAELVLTYTDSTTYDASGNYLREVYYYFNIDSGSVIPDNEILYDYSSESYDEIITWRYYDPELGEWFVNYITGSAVTIDNVSNTRTTILSVLNENFELQYESSKTVIEFNNLDQHTRYAYYSDKTAENVWIPSWEEIYEYSSDGMYRIHFENKQWLADKSEWFSVILQKLTDDGYTSLYKRYDQDWQTGEYYGSEWYEYTYTEFHAYKTSLAYNWDYSAWDWVGFRNINREFDDQKRLVTYENMGWEPSINDWWTSYITRYSYNENGTYRYMSNWYRENHLGELYLSAGSYYYYYNLNDNNLLDSDLTDVLDITVNDTSTVVTIPVELLGDLNLNDVVEFVVTLSNGDPLPDWIIFDLETLSFILLHSGLKSADEDFEVHLVLVEGDGTQTSVVFTVTEALRSGQISGIADPAGDEYKLTLFPNPASEVLYIEASEKTSFDYDWIRVFDTSGRLMQVSKVQDRSGRIELQVADLESGIYSLVLVNSIGNQKTSLTFMVE